MGFDFLFLNLLRFLLYVVVVVVVCLCVFFFFGSKRSFTIIIIDIIIIIIMIVVIINMIVIIIIIIIIFAFVIIMMNDIGIDKKHQLYIIKKMINIAIRATYYIFCCRKRNWDSPDLMHLMQASIIIIFMIIISISIIEYEPPKCDEIRNIKYN